MSDYMVVVTDHDFEDLSIEREVLADLAEVRDVGGCPSDLEQLTNCRIVA